MLHVEEVVIFREAFGGFGSALGLGRQEITKERPSHSCRNQQRRHITICKSFEVVIRLEVYWGVIA